MTVEDRRAVNASFARGQSLGIRSRRSCYEESNHEDLDKDNLIIPISSQSFVSL